jgi:phospholipase D1/2
MFPAIAQQSLFEEGRNCRRVAAAGRVAFVVDGDDYFRLFMEAAERARESIIVVAWDFNSNCCLDVECDAKDPRAKLGEYLNDLARRRRGLHIHVLDWDFPMIYAKDREAPVKVRLGWGWKPHRRVHLEFDNTHPPGGSHHQKIVVIDDAIAFCGGLDLTCQRWDTSAHAPGDPHRVVADQPYPPFHDLMIAVDGEAARELGRIVRERWRASTGKDLPPVRAGADPWPPDLKPALTGLPVAIAVTAPESAPQQGKREVEALYLDMIARAKRYIYIENQYFTAHKIGEALEARLREPGGPEIVVVTRLLSHGWLEEYTMGVLRSKMADGTCIDVHSKMMAVDDEWLRIGSANINNRSMGVDTECDLAIEAGGRADVAHAIRRFRDQLLAEHLGVAQEEVERETTARGSIAGAIRALEGPGRTLKCLEVEHYSDITLSLAEMTDPEQAVGVDKLKALFSFGAEFHSVPRPLRKVLPYVALAGALFMLWRFTPLRGVLRIGRRESAVARLWKKMRR